MAKPALILGVHLLNAAQEPVRVGTLTRDAEGGVSFAVSETYLSDERRPILSLGWYNPTSEENTRARLSTRRDKVGVRGTLPPWFSGLLPEGALRELVLTEMGPGDHDQVDVIARLGADLPGAVLVTPETDELPTSGPLRYDRVKGLKAVDPKGVVKFSLAGVQLKLTANIDGEKLTLPGRGDSGRCIVKLPTDRFKDLPEVEHGAMQLARLAGVQTAETKLVSRDQLRDVPAELLEHGPNVLVVERFDRTAGEGRVHIEDVGQVLGAIDLFKYTMGTTDTVLNTINRFSNDRRADLAEAFRRITVDVLLGNGDNHLKNWSFIFPEPGKIRLSPAYDIVPTVLYMPRDQLALKLAGTQRFESVSLHRFERLAKFFGLDPRWVFGIVSETVRRALDGWEAAADLPGRSGDTLMKRMEKLPLVREVCSVQQP